MFVRVKTYPNSPRRSGVGIALRAKVLMKAQQIACDTALAKGCLFDIINERKIALDNPEANTTVSK